MPDDLVFDQGHQRQLRFSRVAQRIDQVGLQPAPEGRAFDFVDTLAVARFLVSDLDF